MTMYDEFGRPFSSAAAVALESAMQLAVPGETTEALLERAEAIAEYTERIDERLKSALPRFLYGGY